MNSPNGIQPLEPAAGPVKKRYALLTVLFLIPVMVTAVATYRSTVVETDLVEQSLFRQAEMVARGVEAGLSVGMMHSAWTKEMLQDLLDANLSESGAGLIYLTSPAGLVAASSGPVDIKELPGALAGGTDAIPADGLFLREPDLYLFRKAVEPRPGPGNRPGRMGGMMRMHRALSILPEGLSVTVALDASGASYLKRHHARMNLYMALFLAFSITGIAGWGFWSNRARETVLTLARTRAYAAEIISHMPAGLILCGTDGRIAVTNPGAARILGVTEERLRKMSAQSIFPEAILSCRTLREGRKHPVSEGTMEFAGRTLNVNLSATPLTKEDGDPGGFLILFQDTSELEDLRGELARSRRLAEIGELSATVAHEIRNPLSSIRGLAQLLQGKVDQGQAPMMRTIVQEVDRLNRVVTGLLSYARQENLDLKQWDISDILEHVVLLAEGDARLRDVRLHAGVRPVGLSWVLDRDLIVQALLNLVINAIEVSGEDQVVDITADEGDGSLVMRITDRGYGVPEDSEKLFSLFETTKEGGTGLGLPLVRKVAQLHGGSAAIHRAAEGGSEAVITLPHRNAP